MFTVREVDGRRAQQLEFLGTKRKFWFRDGAQRLLFKADDRGTGEDWAEVIACHLSRLLGLPHVEYELAVDIGGRLPPRPGVACLNMSPPPKSLILGNQLLLTRDPDYPSNQRFKVRQHTVDAICNLVESMGPPEPPWMSNTPLGIRTAMDVFVGYLLLDVWISNQDRHHENWGAIRSHAENDLLTLAPTFDHGAGLARNLLDTERQERLTTKDHNRTLNAFVTRARSAIYASPSTLTKPLLLLDVYRRFAARMPFAASIWLDRLRAVTRDQVSDILNRVPSDRMSPVCRQFTLELLEINRQRLLQGEKSE